MNASGQPEILALDDDVEILNVLRLTLEGAGFQVHTAESAREGLDLYEKFWKQIQLVMLDYLMPEMNGDLVFECMQRINPNVKVLLLTGCENHVARKMFAHGLRGLIQKPFYLDDLIQRVRDEIETGDDAPKQH